MRLPRHLWSPELRVINLASLALLIWGTISQAHFGTSGRHLAALVLVVVASAAWVAWVVARSIGDEPLCLALLVLMAAAGGGLLGYASLAAVFAGVAALGASEQLGARQTGLVAAVGGVAMALGILLTGHNAGAAVGGVAAILAGAGVGLSRRQAHERVAQVALLQSEKDRAEVARQRSELLAERNRLGREIHDVLAHTLSALAVQLEALDSVVESEGVASDEVRQHMERSRRLVREGLAEARRAVHALRSDPVPLVDQMEGLAEAGGVTLAVNGDARALAPEVSHALYRAAQEALANVAKHAPGAPATVALDFGPHAVRLTVTNPAHLNGGSSGPGTGRGHGGGYGLQGMRERAMALGGRVDAGPQEHSWRVEMELPA